MTTRAVLVAGIGCRSGVTPQDVVAAIAIAIEKIRPEQPLELLATIDSRGHEPGVVAAAQAQGVPLVLISKESLQFANTNTLTHSERSFAAFGVRSVSEAAALAAAGPNARLLAARVAVGPVTCALAVGSSTL